MMYISVDDALPLSWTPRARFSTFLLLFALATDGGVAARERPGQVHFKIIMMVAIHPRPVEYVH